MSEARNPCSRGHDWLKKRSLWRRLFPCSECMMEMQFGLTELQDALIVRAHRSRETAMGMNRRTTIEWQEQRAAQARSHQEPGS